MDNSNNKTPRKAHDLNTKIEEESLWDLDDDWEDVDDEASGDAPESENAPDVEEATDEDVSTEEAAETEEELSDDSSGEQEVVESEEVVDENIETVEDSQDEQEPPGDDDEFDFGESEEEDEGLDASALELPEEEVTPPTEEQEQEEEADQSDPIDSYDEFDLDDDDAESSVTQSEDDEGIVDDGDDPSDDAEPELSEDELTEESPDTEPSPETNQLEALVEPLKKLSLSMTEKIALSAVAAIFIGLLIYSYSWLQGKNNESVVEELQFPIKGEYATISDFSTYWKTPGKAPGIKLGAEVVPAANITLDDNSSSGALRIFFRNATNDRIGDTITVKFTDGKFANGSNTINVSASDGFHLKGDFHAYQMDNSLAWTVYVLEAASSSASGADYKELIKTSVAPVMQ